MKKVKVKLTMRDHIRRFKSHFEIVCAVGAIALIGDFYWLMHDVFINGMSVSYGVVGVALAVGIFGTMYVLYQHNFAPKYKYKKVEYKRSSK